MPQGLEPTSSMTQKTKSRSSGTSPVVAVAPARTHAQHTTLCASAPMSVCVHPDFFTKISTKTAHKSEHGGTRKRARYTTSSPSLVSHQRSIASPPSWRALHRIKSSNATIASLALSPFLTPTWIDGYSQPRHLQLEPLSMSLFIWSNSDSTAGVEEGSCGVGPFFEGS